MPLPLSVLELAPVRQGGTIRDALERTLAVTRQAERLGYSRVWVAEHHNAPGIASSATAVVIGYLAANTESITLGSGGIMLPNHSPLVVAEQFGTLESLYPGRIELGLGRAPGTDMETFRALRRTHDDAERFPEDVQELQQLLGPRAPGQRVQAIPGTDTNVPIWILGSSLFGAQLAALFGLPYAFASHFAPDALVDAVRTYRENFRPSKQLDRPRVMAGVNVLVADTEAEARQLFTSTQQRFADFRRPKDPGLTKPPIDDIEQYWTPHEKALAGHMLRYSIVGSPQTVREELESFAKHADADELIVVTNTYDEEPQMRSFELLAEVAGLSVR
jgi:luciferase family oxidoreductase group 1